MGIKYAVDKIDNNIITLENLDNCKLEYINKEALNFEVKEKDIIVYKDNAYIKDDNLKNERLNSLKEKFDKLKRK